MTISKSKTSLCQFAILEIFVCVACALASSDCLKLLVSGLCIGNILASSACLCYASITSCILYIYYYYYYYYYHYYYYHYYYCYYCS